MQINDLSLAVIGAGMGGLSTAAALRKFGIKATVYEQTPQFSRVGAGIQIACNAMNVLREFGIEDRLRSTAFYPRSWNHREYDNGEVRFDMIFGREAEEKWGAPYLLAHRGDLHTALASAVPEESIQLDHKLVGLSQLPDSSIELNFANGRTAIHDGIIATDGVHSIVSRIIFGEDQINFTGRVAYRAVFPTSLLGGLTIDDCTKWWGPDKHVVIYFVTADRSEVYFVTSQIEPEFQVESWSTLGSVQDLRAAFEDFNPEVQHVLAACPAVHKWAIVDRDPVPTWVDGNIVLLGDACHPMTPYMAQGAAMAIEDAAVLARCLDGVDRDGLNEAFRRFEATRKERTTGIQMISRSNTWLSGPTEPSWVYGYDAWNTPLAHQAISS